MKIQRLSLSVGSRALIPALAALALTGCGDSGSGNGSTPDTETVAVVSTAAPDFSSGAHAVISTEAPFNSSTNLDSDGSDLTVDAHGDAFYRLARSQMNYIAKYPADSPAQSEWQFSLTDLKNAAASPNPYDLVFAADDKAYLLQYGGTHVQVVDPSVSDGAVADFRTASLDLSSYANAPGTTGYSGTPQMAEGVLVGNRLYVLMQRLDDNYQPQKAYVAVFDTATDQEIDVSPNDAAYKGIALEVRNPQSIRYDAANSQLLIGAVGDYAGAKNGGVEAIDLADTDCTDNSCYSTQVLIDDDAADAVHGRVSDIALVDGDTAYLVGYHGWQDNALYAFNPQDGTIETDSNGDPKVIGGLSGANLADIAVSPADRLWVSVADSKAPGVAVIDPADHSIVTPLISTDLNPGTITFASRAK